MSYDLEPGEFASDDDRARELKRLIGGEGQTLHIPQFVRKTSPVPSARPDTIQSMEHDVAKLRSTVTQYKQALAELQINFERLDEAVAKLRRSVLAMQLALGKKP